MTATAAERAATAKALAEPHHDGSDICVLERAADLDDTVVVRMRAPRGAADEVLLRAVIEGEPKVVRAVVDEETADETWWRAEFPQRTPVVRYRWLLCGGTVGYGWLNFGWATGAFVSSFYAPLLIKQFGSRRSIAISLGALAVLMIAAPTMPFFALAVVVYSLMGSGRGITGVALNTSLMDQVPKHFMGRVQNTFYATGTALQVLQSYLVGAVAQVNLIAGFSVIGLVYALGFISATWPVRVSASALEDTQSK